MQASCSYYRARVYSKSWPMSRHIVTLDYADLMIAGQNAQIELMRLHCPKMVKIGNSISSPSSWGWSQATPDHGMARLVDADRAVPLRSARFQFTRCDKITPLNHEIDPMQILLTNDDGVFAPGLRALRKELLRLGDVTVVAPAMEQSGVAHSITLLSPLVVKQVEDIDGATLG